MKTRLLIIIGVVIAVTISVTVGYLLYYDEPQTPWDCRMKYGKVKQDIQNCLDNLPSEIVSPHIKTESIPEPESQQNIDNLKGIFGNCACQERQNPDANELCTQPFIDWENATHYINNNICGWREK